MPKKTKRQKILATLHRKLQYSNNLQTQDIKLRPNSVNSQNTDAKQNILSAYTAPFNIAKETVMKAKNTTTESSYKFVKNDLIKITIFTALALVSQGVLYFLLRTR